MLIRVMDWNVTKNEYLNESENKIKIFDWRKFEYGNLIG